MRISASTVREVTGELLGSTVDAVRIDELGRAFPGRVGIAVQSVDQGWMTGWRMASPGPCALPIGRSKRASSALAPRSGLRSELRPIYRQMFELLVGSTVNSGSL